LVAEIDLFRDQLDIEFYTLVFGLDFTVADELPPPGELQ